MFLQNSPQFTPGNFEGHEVWELGVQGTATHNRGQCRMEGETLRSLWCLVLCRRTRWEVDSGVHPGDTAPDSGLVRKGSPGAVPGRGRRAGVAGRGLQGSPVSWDRSSPRAGTWIYPDSQLSSSGAGARPFPGWCAGWESCCRATGTISAPSGLTGAWRCDPLPQAGLDPSSLRRSIMFCVCLTSFCPMFLELTPSC